MSNIVGTCVCRWDGCLCWRSAAVPARQRRLQFSTSHVHRSQWCLDVYIRITVDLCEASWSDGRTSWQCRFLKLYSNYYVIHRLNIRLTMLTVF